MNALFYHDIEAYVRELVMQQMIDDDQAPPHAGKERGASQTEGSAVRKRETDIDR